MTITPSPPAPSGRVSESAAFTPGPWELTEADDAEYLIRMGTHLVRGGRKAPHHEISYAHGIYVDDDYPEAQDEYAEATANARLIAAAPELFEALESLLPCVGSPVPLPDTAERVRHAVAALAKALGHE